MYNRKIYVEFFKKYLNTAVLCPDLAQQQNLAILQEEQPLLLHYLLCLITTNHWLLMVVTFGF